MDLFVLNTNLETVAVVDIYEEFRWTDRYNKYGDFELYTPVREDLLTYLVQDYYLVNRESEHVMIIEELKIVSDAESGNRITVAGRSLESILDRRIIWGQKTLGGNLQNAIETLLNECIISPSNPDRQISNFIFEASTDPAITGLTISAQYTGDNLYEVIEKICEEQKIGFKITLNLKNQFVFKLYSGVNRSYDQMEVPYVIFSPKFDNLINSKYLESKVPMKNVTLIGGEGQGYRRTYATVGSGVGLNRREMFTDARDISSDDGTDTGMSEGTYLYLLEYRGKEDLAENKEIVAFEGKAETSTMFTYREDYFIGDIVQVANEYGHETKARIIEMIISDDTAFSIYPTFETITEEGE